MGHLMGMGLWPEPGLADLFAWDVGTATPFLLTNVRGEPYIGAVSHNYVFIVSDT